MTLKKGGHQHGAKDKDKVGEEHPVPPGRNGRMRSATLDHAPEVHWVAAESLDAALRYMRQRNDDFTITETRFLGVFPLLSGSPLD